MAVQTLNQVQGDGALLFGITGCPAEGFFAPYCQNTKSHGWAVQTLNQVQGDRALLDGFFLSYAAMEGRTRVRYREAVMEAKAGTPERRWRKGTGGRVSQASKW